MPAVGSLNRRIRDSLQFFAAGEFTALLLPKYRDLSLLHRFMIGDLNLRSRSSARVFWRSCLTSSGRNNFHATIFIPEIADPGECRLYFGRVPDAIISRSAHFDLQ